MNVVQSPNCENMLKEWYQNNSIYFCIFIDKSQSIFVIIVYIDNLNIIETLQKLSNAIEYLKKYLKRKISKKTKIWLGLQIEHLTDVSIHEKSWKMFYLEKTHPLKILIEVRSLDIRKDISWYRDGNEKLLGPKVSYHSAIGVLIYLFNNTWLDIAFFINLLVRHSSFPTKRHWNIIKHILPYFQKTMNICFIRINWILTLLVMQILKV